MCKIINTVLHDYQKKRDRIVRDILNRHQHEPLPDLIDDIPDEQGMSEILETVSNKEGDIE